jgi:hypothetical protein
MKQLRFVANSAITGIGSPEGNKNFCINLLNLAFIVLE